jgi:hypothetical protein
LSIRDVTCTFKQFNLELLGMPVFRYVVLVIKLFYFFQTRLSGAVALAEFIAESPRLLRLDLRGNHIRTGGLMALTLSLKVNQSVTRLDLDQEPKKEAVSVFVE